MRLKPQKQLQTQSPFTEVNGNKKNLSVIPLPSVLTDGSIKPLNELALAAFSKLSINHKFQYIL